MVFFNYALRKLNAKIVYYGPGLCGKTTNLQWIHDHMDGGNCGKMVSLATEGDRTIFFDLLPLDIGTIRGMDVTLQLYTVPGQVHYNATRQLVLRGADGVVFVADSQRAMLRSNRESWSNLAENLRMQGVELASFPHVIQFNKRDLREIVPMEELDEELNQYSAPIFEASAIEGIGVQDTLESIVKLVMRSLRDRYEVLAQKGTLRRRAAPVPAPAPSPATGWPAEAEPAVDAPPPLRAREEIGDEGAQNDEGAVTHPALEGEYPPEVAAAAAGRDLDSTGVYEFAEPSPGADAGAADVDEATGPVDQWAEGEADQGGEELEVPEGTFESDEIEELDLDAEIEGDTFSADEPIAAVDYAGGTEPIAAVEDAGESEPSAPDDVAEVEAGGEIEAADRPDSAGGGVPGAPEVRSPRAGVDVEEWLRGVAQVRVASSSVDDTREVTAPEASDVQPEVPVPVVDAGLSEEAPEATSTELKRPGPVTSVSDEDPFALGESAAAGVEASPAGEEPFPSLDDRAPGPLSELSSRDWARSSPVEAPAAEAPPPSVSEEDDLFVDREVPPLADLRRGREGVVLEGATEAPVWTASAPGASEPFGSPIGEQDVASEVGAVAAVPATPLGRKQDAGGEAGTARAAAHPGTARVVTVGEGDPFAEPFAGEPEVLPAERVTAVASASLAPREGPLSRPAVSGVQVVPGDNQLHVRLEGTGALAESGQVRELDIVVPVPGGWIGNRRVTLQLRLTLTPAMERGE